MSFESMDTTKSGKHPKPKKGGTEITETAQPIETADTALSKRMRIESPKGPGVVVPPKTEKEEFSERLTRFDEEETAEETEKLRKEISGEEKKSAPFLEHQVSEEAAQARILENLTTALKETSGTRDIDRDELEKIIASEGDIAIKIKKILNLAAADRISDITKREKIFNIIYDALKKREGRDIRQAFEEVSELESITSAEKKERIAEKINQIKEKYGIEEIFEYLKLGEKEGGTIELE